MTTTALLGTIVTGNLPPQGRGKVRKAFDALAFEAADNGDGTDIDSNPTGIIKSGRGYVFTDSGGNTLVSTRRGGSTLATFAPVPTTQPGPVPVGTPGGRRADRCGRGPRRRAVRVATRRVPVREGLVDDLAGRARP